MKNSTVKINLALGLAICLVFSITGCRGGNGDSSDTQSSGLPSGNSSSFTSSVGENSSSSDVQTGSQDTNSSHVSVPQSDTNSTTTTPSEPQKPPTDPVTPATPPDDSKNDPDKIAFPETLICAQNKGNLYENNGIYYYLNKDNKICSAASETTVTVLIDQMVFSFEALGEYGYFISKQGKLCRFPLNKPTQITDYNITTTAFTVATLSNGETYLFYQQNTTLALIRKNVDGSGAELTLVTNHCDSNMQVVNEQVYFLWRNPATDEDSLCAVSPNEPNQDPSRNVVSQYAYDFAISGNYIYYAAGGNAGGVVYRINLENGNKDLQITADYDCYGMGIRGKWLYYCVMIDRDVFFKRAPIDGSNPAGTIFN